MKYIVLILIIVGGYYFYETKSDPNTEIEVKTHRDIYTKLALTPVSTSEIITGATEFALSMCDDISFQNAGGETTSSCKNKFTNFKTMCSNQVFGEEEQLYSSKNKVDSLSKRFINCVSI